MAKKKPKPSQTVLPSNPVDAFVVMAKAMGIEDRLDPAELDRWRRYCDEPVTTEQAAAEAKFIAGPFRYQAGPMAAAALGRLGGSVSSPAKRRAVKANGKKGGRPKGSKDSSPRKRRPA
jgi:hypothetical protein